MGILKSAADLVYTIRFLKLLVTPFEKLGAYKAGIIDIDGKRNPDFNTLKADDREAYRTHYTTFHRLVINLKRLMAKAPGGKSVIARYGAALLLIKEHGELSDADLEKIHQETGIDELQLIEEQSQWFMLKDGSGITPGVYKMLHDTTTTQVDDIVKKDDTIRIEEGLETPIDNVLGVDIFQATHMKSQRKIYISSGEITR